MTAHRFLSAALVAYLALAAASPIAARQATASPHGALPEELTCTSCHTTDAWAPLRGDLAFDHASTGFSLDGRHAAVTCARCHSGLAFATDGERGAAGIGECASCHLDVHQGSITRTCASCHSAVSFADVDIGVAHPADFPLAGAHLQISCESCHQSDLGGAYRALDTECSSCHMGDYFRAPVVDHQALGFSTFCTDCHSTTSFRDIAFDHFAMSGGFELAGRHAAIDCTTCHNGPGGDVLLPAASPDDCVACHVDDYDREHRGTGFPTSCVACHDTFGWDGASFEHSFPIFSGAHAGEWNACADCHQTPSDYASFSCLGCHRQAETDTEHQGERGYAYDSPTCLSCHPDGRH